jgi:transposase
VIPDKITLLALPPYSPELNPVERIWHYLRSHWLANSIFRGLSDIRISPSNHMLSAAALARPFPGTR